MAIEHAHQHIVGRGVTASVMGLGLAAASAMLLRSPLALDSAYPVRVSAVFVVIAACALLGLRVGHPFPRLGIANLVTGGRAIVVACLAGVALAPRPAPAWLLVAIATLAALADACDGPLARRSGMASTFGARFDMEVDALFILVLSILAWRVALVGPWIVTAGVLRYAFVVAGVLWAWMRADLPPSRRRQAACVAQIVALIVTLVPGLPAASAGPIAALGLGVLSWSFARDVSWLVARANP